MTVTAGTNQTYLVIPNSGYKIRELWVDGNLVEECDDEVGLCWVPSQYTFTNVDRNHTISVDFAQAYIPPTTYTISAGASSGGKISPSGNVTVTAGKNQTFIALPNSGYRLIELLVDGNPIYDCDDEIDMCWVPSQYTFTNVREVGHTIRFNFAR